MFRNVECRDSTRMASRILMEITKAPVRWSVLFGGLDPVRVLLLIGMWLCGLSALALEISVIAEIHREKKQQKGQHGQGVAQADHGPGLPIKPLGKDLLRGLNAHKYADLLLKPSRLLLGCFRQHCQKL